jgi:hypothetical protein
MLETCYYKSRTPMDIALCNHCSLFLETCTPIAGYDGYSFGECEAYFCECCVHECSLKVCINL